MEIVLIEDDPGHARLIERNLRRQGLPNQLTLFEDGESGLNYLASRDGDPQGDCLVLLDLNLPRLDGYEVLQKLRLRESTRQLPVFIVTTTNSPDEVRQCYDLGCNAYLSKPTDYRSFCETISRLGSFLEILQVPD